jgi:hypothetical protein
MNIRRSGVLAQEQPAHGRDGRSISTRSIASTPTTSFYRGHECHLRQDSGHGRGAARTGRRDKASAVRARPSSIIRRRVRISRHDDLAVASFRFGVTIAPTEKASFAAIARPMSG